MTTGACTRSHEQACTNDCGGYYRDPALARKVAQDTGLSICPEASIFQTSSAAMEHDPVMPEYAVQVVMESYCDPSLVEQVERRLNQNSMQTLYDTPSGNHVTLSALPYSGYVISVRKPPHGNGS